MNDINYAELYDVKSGERDFFGAIKRSLNNGIQHLDKNFIKYIKNNKNINRKDYE